MSKFDKEFRLNELNEPVVFITSTTGDGEQPETATKCWNKLKRLNSNYLVLLIFFRMFLYTAHTQGVNKKTLI